MRHARLFVEHDDDVIYSRVRLARDVMKHDGFEHRFVKSGVDERLRE